MQVLAYFERSSVEQVLYDLPRNKLKQNMKDMTFFLFELADQGDGVAIQIVREFATSISKYVASGITKYGMRQSDMDVVLIGGLFKTKYPLLIDIITCEIHSVAPRAKIIKAAYEPIIGAMKMGLETLYRTGIPNHVLQNCHVTAGQFQLTRNNETE
jgi:N-acetylglucosamine kinase-like BadF-type ATPase